MWLSVRFIFITRHSCGCSQFASPTLRDIPADVVNSLHLRYATFLRTLSVRSTCVTRHAAKKMDHAGKIARAARLLLDSVHRWRISAIRFTIASGLPRYCRKSLHPCAQETERVRYVGGLMCCKASSPFGCSLRQALSSRTRIADPCRLCSTILSKATWRPRAKSHSLSRSIAWVGYSIARAARLLHNSVRRWCISAVRSTLASGLPRYCRKSLQPCAQETERVRYVGGLMGYKASSPSVCSLRQALSSRTRTADMRRLCPTILCKAAWRPRAKVTRLAAL